MKNKAAESIIAEVAERTTSRVKVIDLVHLVVKELNDNGINAVNINDRGVEVEGERVDYLNGGFIWFRRDNKNDCWKAFQVLNCKEIKLTK